MTATTNEVFYADQLETVSDRDRQEANKLIVFVIGIGITANIVILSAIWLVTQ